MCQGNPQIPKAATGSQLNPIKPAASPMQGGLASQLRAPFVPQGVNPMQGWQAPVGGGTVAQGFQNAQGQLPVTQPVRAPAPDIAQPQAAPSPTPQTVQSVAAPQQVRTGIVTGGKDIYRDALASELKKGGNLKKGVGVI